VLSLAGNGIYKVVHARMLAAHIDNRADVTIGVWKCPKKTGSILGRFWSTRA